LDEGEIFAAQMRAARGLLGWSQADLSRASKVSTAVVARMELGTADSRISTVRGVTAAFQAAGVEFIKHPDGTYGILRRRPAIALEGE